MPMMALAKSEMLDWEQDSNRTLSGEHCIGSRQNAAAKG